MVSSRILQQGTLHCFPAGLKDAEGRLVNAEVSAVAYDGKRLLLASDKPIPGEHPVVRFDCGLSSLEYDPYHVRLYLLNSFEVEEAAKNASADTSGRSASRTFVLGCDQPW